jgi:hypothetical protein
VRNRSPFCQIASSASVIGNAKGVKNGVHCLSFPKHRRAELRITPRGSNPTMSNRARTSALNRIGAAKSTMSKPEPPGPPGLTNSDPIRRAGSLAGSRSTAIEIVPPSGPL